MWLSDLYGTALAMRTDRGSRASRGIGHPDGLLSGRPVPAEAATELGLCEIDAREWSGFERRAAPRGERLKRLFRTGRLPRNLPAALVLLLTAFPGAAESQAAPQATLAVRSLPAPERARVLIVGTHHLAGSGDYMAGEPDDILSERRQREVEEVVRRLARFRPTKIAVEVPAERDSSFQALYREYLAGAHPLGRSESQQIGFRLARHLGHRKLYAIDYKLNEDVGQVVRWAAEHGDTGFVSLVGRFAGRMKAAQDSLRALPLVEALRRQNTPEYDALHSAYMRMARVGGGEEYIGAEVVAGRYERNLKIFANLARIAEPGDRILVIYGASHGKLLRDFVRESEDLELVSAEPFLSSSAFGRR